MHKRHLHIDLNKHDYNCWYNLVREPPRMHHAPVYEKGMGLNSHLSFTLPPSSFPSLLQSIIPIGKLHICSEVAFSCVYYTIKWFIPWLSRLVPLLAYLQSLHFHLYTKHVIEMTRWTSIHQVFSPSLNCPFFTWKIFFYSFRSTLLWFLLNFLFLKKRLGFDFIL